MASKYTRELATSTVLTDMTRLASVLGVFGLALDYRSEQRARKWHAADDEASATRHQERMTVLREIRDEIRLSVTSGNRGM